MNSINHQGCFSINFKFKQTLIRNQIKGMVVIDRLQLKCNIVSEFKAKIKVLHHYQLLLQNSPPLVQLETARINMMIMMKNI